MGNFVEKLRRDSLPMGLFIGFICPAVFFGIMYGIIMLVQHQTGALNIERMIQKSSAQIYLILQKYIQI